MDGSPIWRFPDAASLDAVSTSAESLIMTDEKMQEKFEAWAWQDGRFSLVRAGGYRDMETESAFLVWQAAIASVQPELMALRNEVAALEEQLEILRYEEKG